MNTCLRIAGEDVIAFLFMSMFMDPGLRRGDELGER